MFVLGSAIDFFFTHLRSSNGEFNFSLTVGKLAIKESCYPAVGSLT